MNKENLLKLADYLEGPLKAAFDMERFSKDGDGKTCGTVGCAVGHAPFIGLERRPRENWVEYSFRVFGLDSYHEYSFLFDSAWGRQMNDPHKTAKRIRWFVYHGIPDSWGLNFAWIPPTKPKAEPKTVYRTVVIDSAVRELQQTIGEN